jgi:hypothetical protein
MTDDVQLSIAIARDYGLPLPCGAAGTAGPAARCAPASALISAALAGGIPRSDFRSRLRTTPHNYAARAKDSALASA